MRSVIELFGITALQIDCRVAWHMRHVQQCGSKARLQSSKSSNKVRMNVMDMATDAEFIKVPPMLMVSLRSLEFFFFFFKFFWF